ncbi:hypothetical protein [Streptomyces sp. NPDC053079]|uniref:terpene synthase family protein n=1 Tax=Streptomyces sp. NPDC053079 TaxID=3365697 RepID=UPI0037CEC40A
MGCEANLPPPLLPRRVTRPFDLPFAARTDVERHRAAAHSRSWMHRMGLLPDGRARHRDDRHDRPDMPLWAASVFGDATGPDLDLCSDHACWWAHLDELLDGPVGHDAVRVRRLVADLVAVVTGGVPGGAVPAAEPVVAALADLWARERQGMSPAWRARAVGHWAGFLHTCAIASDHRHHRHRPGRRTALGIEDYLQLRAISGVVWVILDFAERVGHYEVPPDILESAPMQAMRRITARVTGLTQDVRSLPEEEAAGDPDNMVLVLQAQGLTREQAINHVHAVLREQTATFLTEEAHIPRLCDRLSVPQRERARVYQHIADMRAIMRGSHDFCLTGRRSVRGGNNELRCVRF